MTYTITMNTGRFGKELSCYLEEKENGQIVHTKTIIDTHFPHGHGSFPDSDRNVFRLSCNCTSILNTSSLIRILRDGSTVAQKSFSVIGTYTIEYRVNAGIDQQGPPTYLEELAKLDQYSKAQYIPTIR